MAHKLKAYKVKAHKDWNNLQQCMPALITEMINMKKKAQKMWRTCRNALTVVEPATLRAEHTKNPASSRCTP